MSSSLSEPPLARLPGTLSSSAGIAHLVGEVEGVQGEHVAVGPDRGQVLLAAHHERADRRPVGGVHGLPEQGVRPGVLVAGRGQPVGAVEVDRVDLVEVDEVGDLQRPGPAGRHRVQLVGLDDHVLAVADVGTLHDLVELDLAPGALVDPLVAHPVGGAALELVEVDRVVLGRAEHPDRDRHQPERDRPRPDRPGHTHRLPGSSPLGYPSEPRSIPRVITVCAQPVTCLHA